MTDQVTKQEIEATEELTQANLEQVAGGSHGTGAGAGKVSMQDFHFVMRSSRATPAGDLA